MPSLSLPSIVSKLPNDVRLFLDRIKELVGSGELVTRSELVSAGIAGYTRGGGLVPADGTPITPPAPENVAVTGAMTTIFVEWDEPLYYGHAYAEIWRANADNFGQAVLVGQTPGMIFADAVGAAANHYYWVRFVSITDTPGPFNATAGTQGQTSPDPGYLLEQLTGQMGESQLITSLRTRINLLDGADINVPVPADILGGVLATVRSLRAEQSGSKRHIDDAYEKITQVLLQLKRHDDTFRGAGINIDPASGKVTIYAVDQLRTALTSTRSELEIQLDAVESEIALRATRSYVDQQIAAAVLSVQDLAALDNIYARLDLAEITIDAVAGEVQLKASQTVVDGINDRLTTAEGTVTTLQGEVELKAEQTDLDTLGGRVTTAESTLSSIDGASISQSARDSRYLLRGEDAAAERTLAAMMAAHQKANANLGALADAKQDISGRVSLVDGQLVSEAQARLQLAALVASNFAYLENNYYTRTGTDLAIASAVTTLGAAIDANSAAIQFEAEARADADDAIAFSVETLTSTVGGHSTSIQQQALTIGGLSAQFTVKIDNNGYVTGYGLASEEVDGVPTSEFAIVADKFTIAPVLTDHTASDGSPFFYLTAPTTIGGVLIPAGAYMKAAFIVDASITNAKIGNAAIDSAKIADLAVVSAKIADLAVTGAKIANASITTAKIADAQITGAKIDTATIETANIANGAITSIKIGDAAITSAKIGDAAIENAHIKNLSVDTLKLSDSAATTIKIAPNAVSISALVSTAAEVYVDPDGFSSIGPEEDAVLQTMTIVVPAGVTNAILVGELSYTMVDGRTGGGSGSTPDSIDIKRSTNGGAAVTVAGWQSSNVFVWGNYGFYLTSAGPHALIFYDVISAGTHVYTAKYYSGMQYEVRLSNRVLRANVSLR